MKVLYDHQMFSLQKYGGITKYFCELIKCLPGNIEYDIALLFSENEHMYESRRKIQNRYLKPTKKQYPGRNFINNKLIQLNKFYSAKKIEKNNFDVFHPTFYDPYFLQIIRKPFIITVHDLIEFKFETVYGKQNPIHSNMEKLIRRADRIIAISQNTKNDIVDIFGINDSKIDVIYHGFNFATGEVYGTQKGNYILFVGTRIGYKNFNFFLRAITPLLAKERDLRLICVGKGFDKEELEYISSLGIGKQVIARHVTEQELNNLYAGAIAFIYPSLYEGFGMPILEAFANKCPVCLSNTSSFPEVAGDAGAYFDPISKDSILATVEKIVYDRLYRKRLIELGSKRLAQFSWAKAAEQTALSYRNLVNR
jgi:glycosyltransferase involved in cell wall biosynthesis